MYLTSTVAEEKENLVSRQLTRPSGLLSASSTPRSTPRATPIRSMSPMSMSYRSTNINVTHQRHNKFMSPKFYAVPHSRVAEEGETVQFQCAIAGHPMPWCVCQFHYHIIFHFHFHFLRKNIYSKNRKINLASNAVKNN